MNLKDIEWRENELKCLLADMVIIVDSLLLICAIYWKRGIKLDLVKDGSDDLLDIRQLICDYIKEIEDVQEDGCGDDGG